MSTPSVLYLCTGNSCRSQMAEGWTRHLKAGQLDACSAGVAPKGIDPRAVAVMAEVGIDLAGQASQTLDEALEAVGGSVDYVVTVCDNARETCPIFPGDAKVLHHSFDDPPHLAETAASEEEALAHYRRVRDEIRAFVEGLPGNLTNPTTDS